jgi:hypothetical protein
MEGDVWDLFLILKLKQTSKSIIEGVDQTMVEKCYERLKFHR